MERLYDNLLFDNLQSYQQMAFISGPRQVGKTTSGEHLLERFGEGFYLNWDIPAQRLLLLEGVDGIERAADLSSLKERTPVLILDELHKMPNWKNFLKGLYDHLHKKAKIVVTGSARLDVFNRGGDSLMGRYFSYRYHPLSVGEIASPQLLSQPLRPQPVSINDHDFDALLRFGGFPAPFLQRKDEFQALWQGLRFKQLFQEEVRDLTRVQEIKQLETFGELLKHQVGAQVSHESLAKKIRVSANTIRNWSQILQALYYHFAVKPWSQNVSRSLLKEPKYYLCDWSQVEEEGVRLENMVASHLLKAVHYWTDRGWGAFELFYLRNKEQMEVDFLVVRDGHPWLMVEVKKSAQPFNRAFHRFYEQVKPLYAVQVAFDLPEVSQTTLRAKEIWQVPARSFLSQLP